MSEVLLVVHGSREDAVALAATTAARLESQGAVARTVRLEGRPVEATLDEVLAKLTPDNHHIAVALAAIPEKIRGFGHVKQQHLTAAKADEAALLEQFRAGTPALLKAAE